MNSLQQSFIKFFTYVIVGLLVVLMGAFAFMDTGVTSSTMDSLFTGTSAGSFGNRAISQKIFNHHWNQCDQQMQYYRNMLKGQELPPMFTVDACISRELQNRYSRLVLGEELGLDNVKSVLKEEMVEEARQAHQNQDVLHEEEKMSLTEIYQRRLAYYPLEARRLDKVVSLAEAVLNQPIKVPGSIQANAGKAGSISMDIRFIRWDGEAMIKNLEAGVSITEAEMRARHKEEQAKQKEDQRIPFAKDRPFLEKRMRTEKARELQAGIKTKLAGLKAGFTLQDVEKITGMPVQTATSVGLNELGKIKARSGQANLDQAAILKSLSSVGNSTASAGPLQDGRFTIYAEISNLQISADTPASAEDEKAATEMGNMLGREWLNHIITSETRKGQLNVRKVDVQGAS